MCPSGFSLQEPLVRSKGPKRRASSGQEERQGSQGWSWVRIEGRVQIREGSGNGMFLQRKGRKGSSGERLYCD